MKIALITLYDAYNCGSFLQAFAMQQFLEENGFSVDVLDCNKDPLRWLKRVAATTPRKLYIKLQRRKSYGLAWKKLKIKKFKNSAFEYDYTIIGSDEIWNVENPYFNHWKQYFGESIQDSKVIAYAPSIGYANPERILGDSSKCESIRKMNYLFARDNKTKALMERITGKSVKKVCDPTILLLCQWEKYEVAYPLEKDYLLLYDYGVEDFLEAEVKEYAAKHNLLIVSCAFDCSWADRVVIPTPFQFLYLVHHATAILGGTFHISVFASIYNKNFCIQSSMQKTKDFLEGSKQGWRLYKSKGDLASILNKNTDYDTYQYLKEQRNASSSYLLDALNSI
mgnify:CR=1 FL=1